MQHHRFYLSFVFAGLLMLLLSSFVLAAGRPTPTALATPNVQTAHDPFIGIVKQNANLRAGPGANYARIGSVAAQEQVTIVGVNAAGDWYQLANGAWIAAFLVGNGQEANAVPASTTTVKPTPTVPLGPSAPVSNQPLSFASWKVKVAATQRVQSIRATPNNHFQADSGHVIYLVELQWKNTITAAEELTFDPQKVVVVDQQGKVYPSIGGAPGSTPTNALTGESRTFLLHIYHTSGSMLMTYRESLNNTQLALLATATDAKTKQWTIAVNGATTGILTMAFSVPEQAELTELQWPGLPAFSLRPTVATSLPTPHPVNTTLAQPSPTPTAKPKAVPVTGSISGKVFRSDTNAPIANALVALDDSSLDANNPKARIAEVTTDQKGRYTFPSIKPGHFHMTVTASFKQKADLPCPGLAFTRAGWFAGIGTQKATGLWIMIATGVDKDEFAIKAGGALQKDIDLSCNN